MTETFSSLYVAILIFIHCINIKFAHLKFSHYVIIKSIILNTYIWEQVWIVFIWDLKEQITACVIEFLGENYLSTRKTSICFKVAVELIVIMNFYLFIFCCCTNKHFHGKEALFSCLCSLYAIICANYTLCCTILLKHCNLICR